MTNDQIEDEVGKILSTLENMEYMGIITTKERQQLKTNTKAWAYDQMKVNE